MLTFTHDQNGLEIVRTETSILLSGRSSLGISQSGEKALDEAPDIQSAGEARVDKVTTFKRIGDGVNVFLKIYKFRWILYGVVDTYRVELAALESQRGPLGNESSIDDWDEVVHTIETGVGDRNIDSLKIR